MTFAHSAPAVNGWSRLPRSRTAPAVLDRDDPAAAVGAVERAGAEDLGHAIQPTLARVSDSIVLPPGARAVLTGPDFVARGLAARERDPQRRWLLRRPRDVRRDFVEQVIDKAGDQERWMLLQDDETRHSYIDEVLAGGDRQAIWLLRQPRKVRESYVEDVLDA